MMNIKKFTTYFLFSLLSLCLLASVLTFGISAVTISDSDNVHFSWKPDRTSTGFKNPNDASCIITDDSDAGEVAKLTVTADSEDPYIYFDLTDIKKSTAFRADQYKYIIFHIKTPETVMSPTSQLYLATVEAHPSLGEDFVSAFSLNADGKWHYYMVDLSTNPFWSGEVSLIRFDFFQGTSKKGDCIYLDNVLFYSDEIAAYETLIALCKSSSALQPSVTTVPVTTATPSTTAPISTTEPDITTDITIGMEPLITSAPATTASPASNTQEPTEPSGKGGGMILPVILIALAVIAGILVILNKNRIFKILLVVLCAVFVIIAVVTVIVNSRNGHNPDETTVIETTLIPVVSSTEATSATPETTAKPQPESNKSKVIDVAIIDQGYDIYQTSEINGGYRYGCSMIDYGDGRIDAWFASCGGSGTGEWDWISYIHSDNSGETWSNEKVVLRPTADSMDFYSVCDPGVIYLNGYYYMGYTSTISSDMLANNLFVARSKTPDGPYEKWNGNGWGGKPEPIVYFNEDYQKWGIGEPSFVEVNGKLYIYYTKTGGTNYTMVATADANDENWPATVKNHTYAYKRQSSGDSFDVKYVDEYGKFIAVATENRITANSYLAFYESDDGLSFKLSDVVKQDTYRNCHNAGISGTPNGHLLPVNREHYVIYAYGSEWGRWNTRIQKYTISLAETNDISAERSKSNIKTTPEQAAPLSQNELWATNLLTKPECYNSDLSTGKFVIKLYWFDVYRDSHQVIDPTGLVFSDFDTNLLSFNGYVCTPLGIGETQVTASYMGCKTTFTVKVTQSGATVDIGNNNRNKIVAFTSVNNVYTISLHDKSIYGFNPQIRGRIIFGDGSLGELYIEKSQRNSYNVVYSGYDSDIISVSSTGIVTAKKTGATSLTVRCNEFSFEVTVNVVD